ncbi:hypothetical protein DL769_007463 [Monosporascus sp. CRB-8-3]|nr:hypothetical protein DL769_007463 [Monosporascus sp. CRB-8-3]
MASSVATPASGAQSSNPFSRFPNEIILDISQKMDLQDKTTFEAVGKSAVVRLAAKIDNVEILQPLRRLVKEFDWNVRPATDPKIEDVQLQDVDWV